MARDAYRLTARAYDRFVEPMNAPLRRIGRRMCPPRPGWTVVDVGCGTGAGMAEYAEAGCTVIGVDTSSAMLAGCRQRLGPDADLRRAEGSALPVSDGRADLVVISLVLHSIPRPEAIALLREADRALAPRGRILVTEFGTDGLRFPRGWWNRAVTVLAELVAGPTHASHAFGFVRRGGLGTVVAEAGVRIAAQRPSAGGNIVIAVVEPLDATGR